MRGHGERLIDHLYRRVLEAFGVLFVGVLLIVLFRGYSRLSGRGGLKRVPGEPVEAKNDPSCKPPYLRGCLDAESLFAMWIFSYIRGWLPALSLASRFFLTLSLNPRFNGEKTPGKAET